MKIASPKHALHKTHEDYGMIQTGVTMGKIGEYKPLKHRPT